MEKTDKILISILYAIAGCIILFTFFKIKRKKKFAPSYSGLIFGIILYYIITPIITVINIEKMILFENSLGMWGNNTIQRLIIRQPIIYYIYSILMIILLIVFYNIFYLVGYKKNYEKIDTIERQEKRLYKIIEILNYFLFFIGTISLIAFFKSFGGIKNALYYAEYARSFSNNLSELVGDASLFIVTAKFITVVPFLTLILINTELTSKKIYYKNIFIISNILSVLYFMFNAGRAPIIVFILCYVFAFLKGHLKNVWKLIIVVGIFSLPILDVLDELFVYFRTGILDINKSENVLSYVYQFMYPFRNILNLLPMENIYGFNWGKDFIYAFIDILPGISFDASYVNTSIYVNGLNWTVLGGIPNDIITFFHIEAGPIGIIILSSILGILTQKIDINLSKIKNIKNRNLIEGIITIYYFQLVCNSDFITILRGNFMIIIFTIISLYLGKNTIKKETKK